MAEHSRRARPTIFICYRRKETKDFAGRLKDKLEAHFGKRARIFFDHSEINYGDAFPEDLKPPAARNAQVFSARRFERDAEDLIAAPERFVPPLPSFAPSQLIGTLEKYGEKPPPQTAGNASDLPAGLQAVGLVFFIIIFVVLWAQW